MGNSVLIKGLQECCNTMPRSNFSIQISDGNIVIEYLFGGVVEGFLINKLDKPLFSYSPQSQTFLHNWNRFSFPNPVA